jgi:hypothetical protein
MLFNAVTSPALKVFGLSLHAALTGTSTRTNLTQFAERMEMPIPLKCKSD